VDVVIVGNDSLDRGVLATDEDLEELKAVLDLLLERLLVPKLSGTAGVAAGA
jgi:hypothetical protein